MPNCNDCRFAEWAKKSNGHINPKAAGRCTWSKTVRVAAACYLPVLSEGRVYEFKGGYIWRNDGKKDCPVFERK